jgi:hypothetical protein
MSIDRSDINLAFGGAERIGATRRVDRDAPSKQPGDQNGRDRRNGGSGPDPGLSQVPQDVVELSAAAPAVEAPAPPTMAPTPAKELPAAERHLDIQV